MPVRVKICGLRTADTLAAAVDAGADMVGLVRYPKSPRHVDLDRAAALAAAVHGRAEVVVLTVDPTDDELAAIFAALQPDHLQLHGAETPERTVAIGRAHNVKTIKALKVETAADLAAAADYRDAADLILFDAKPPGTATALPGGNGLAFDWQLLRGFKGRYMLSGGLSPANVAEALAVTGAEIVDVSSGVERAPGDKDNDLIREFVRSAKAAG